MQSLAGLLSRWPVPAAFACGLISVGAAGMCFSAVIDGGLMGTGALQISGLHAYWSLPAGMLAIGRPLLWSHLRGASVQAAAC